MRRKIKFRGKHPHIAEWCFGNLVDYGDGRMEIHGFGVFHDGDNDWHEIEVAPDTVGQFTGMKDNDEKEIYEGDIVKDKYENRYEVRYDDKRMSWIAHSSIPFENNLPLCVVTECTIIDNIHDNPELLEDEK